MIIILCCLFQIKCILTLMRFYCFYKRRNRPTQVESTQSSMAEDLLTGECFIYIKFRSSLYLYGLFLNNFHYSMPSIIKIDGGYQTIASIATWTAIRQCPRVNRLWISVRRFRSNEGCYLPISVGGPTVNIRQLPWSL